jgi:RNA polymerase sigma-70 factor, ECF subfamily
VETIAALDTKFYAYLDAGDLRQAGTWLVQRHARDVLGLCGAMVRDPTTAEDLTQDVFGKAFTALGQYRREASSRTWLLAIARNRCIDHLRALQRDPWRGAPPDDASADPDRVPDAAPLPAELLTSRAQVEAALDELVEGERALVVLRYRHGLDYRELAHVFGIRPGTLRMRLSRALSRMRAALERASGELHCFEEEDAEADGLLSSSFAAADLCDAPASPQDASPPPAAAAPAAPARRMAVKARRASAPSGGGFFSKLLGRNEQRRDEAPAAPLASDPLTTTLGQAELPSTLFDRLLALTRSL